MSKVIDYNKEDNCYEFYDEINQQLTSYRLHVGDNCITVNIYQSPILQGGYSNARKNLTWRTKTSYGKEYIRILNAEIERVSTQPVA